MRISDWSSDVCSSDLLPVALTVVEEHTVGPDLGADSIRKGILARVIATVAVLGFMIVTYGRFGLYANIALVINIFLIVGIMALLNATLTLPGLGGFVFTLGSAVDANVLDRMCVVKGKSVDVVVAHGGSEIKKKNNT